MIQRNWRNRPLIVSRRLDHELSAETRQRLGKVIAAHDDDAVNLGQFRDVCQQFMDYLALVGETERLEASFQLQEHCARALTGRPHLYAIGLVGGGGRR